MQLQTRAFGDYVFRPHAVYPSVAAAASACPAWDFVVVTTKALPDRADDAALIAPLVGPQTAAVVLVQNGLGVEAPHRARFPGVPIVSGVTIISAEQVRPGVVVQNRWTRIHLGPYTDSAPMDAPSSPSSSTVSAATNTDLTSRGADAVSRLTDWWTRLGLIRDVDPLTEVGLQTVRWHKLCINAAMNPSAVLSGGRGNADMASDPELRAHLRGVMQEIWDAAPQILGGKGFEDGAGEEGERGEKKKAMATPDKILESTDRNKGARPSMLLDWEAGRPLEIEVILGNPVRIARAKGVGLPRLQSLYALLSSAQGVRERERAKGKL